MSHCPRCVRPVPADATLCPHCAYDIPPLEVAPTLAPAPPASGSSTPALVLSLTAPAPASAPPAPSRPAPDADFRSVPMDELMPIAAEQPADPDQTDVIRLAGAPRLMDRWAPTARAQRTALSGTASRLAQIVRSPQSAQDRRARLILAAATGAALILIVVIVVLATQTGGGSGNTNRAANATTTSAAPASSSASQSAQLQATTISGYLAQSAAARSGVSDAITSIGACRNIASAVATLTNAADTRSRILTSLASAQTGALPQGATLVADLRAALQASADADQHYAAWGNAVSATCTGTAAHTADYTAGVQSDAAATAAKQRFVQNWNVVATQYNLAQQSASTF